MAIPLSSKPNTAAPNSDFPYGDIKDNGGANDGTPINRAVYGDFHQFFAKMLAESGINANGLPENATNGFQYYEALLKDVQGVIDSYKVSSSTDITITDLPAGVTTNIQSKNIHKRGKIVFFHLNLNVTLPADVATFNTAVGFSFRVAFPTIFTPLNAGLNGSSAGSTVALSFIGGTDPKIDYVSFGKPQDVNGILFVNPIGKTFVANQSLNIKINTSWVTE